MDNYMISVNGDEVINLCQDKNMNLFHYFHIFLDNVQYLSNISNISHIFTQKQAYIFSIINQIPQIWHMSTIFH